MGKDAVNGIRITFYVAECMEFPRYGECREDILSAEEAVKFYEAIPSERLNAVKGIGVHVYDQKQPEFLQEFQLVHMGKMDVDMLQAMYGFDDYPQILRAARELISAMPELEVIDTGKLLNEKEDFHKSADVMEIAESINQFQKRIDPDGYESFYPDEEKHIRKIAMQLLVDKGKEGFQKWLEFGRFLESPELSAETQRLLMTLKDSEIEIPYNMEPFVYVDSSEDMRLEEGEVLTLQEAVLLFGRLDYEQCLSRKNKETLGYNKTWFRILYLHEGELCSYNGRQDFGDGNGDLFQHIEAQQQFYSSDEGMEYLKSLPEQEAAALCAVPILIGNLPDICLSRWRRGKSERCFALRHLLLPGVRF
nr:LPD25 domain-containing protein [Murimonas intestini]